MSSTFEFIDIDERILELREEGDYYSFYRGDKLHRRGGPAVVCPGRKYEWYSSGKRHRIFGPAIIDVAQHYFAWYQDNLLHRESGPARRMWSGDEYWIRGQHLSYIQFVATSSQYRTEDLVDILFSQIKMDANDIVAIRKGLIAKGMEQEKADETIQSAEFVRRLI